MPVARTCPSPGRESSRRFRMEPGEEMGARSEFPESASRRARSARRPGRATSRRRGSILALLLVAASHFAEAAEPLDGARDAAPSEPAVVLEEQASTAIDEAWLTDPATLLREGRAAAERPEFARADRLFEELGRRHSIVGDFAALFRARALLAAGRAPDAAQEVERALSDHPTSPLRAELHALQGDLRRATGDESGARAAWALAYSEHEAPEQRATLLALVAESQERSGDLRSARASWLRLWSRHPASPEAAVAGSRLDALEAKPGTLSRSADDWRQRADRLFSEMHNEPALEAYDRALALGLSGALRTPAETQRAHTLFRLRRYPQALEAFDALPQRGDIPIWRARSLARADRVPESIAAFERLARAAGPNQADARFFAASLLEGRGREEEARVHLVWLSDDPRQGELTRSALWRLGWSDYRNRRPADAVARFEALEKATIDPIARLKATYWRARALDRVGRKPEAAVAFGALARDYPLSYYGWRAREHAATPIAAARPSALAAGKRRLTPSALARVHILIDAGLHDYGAAETGRLVRRVAGLEDRLELARLLTEAGDYHTAQKLVVDAYELTLARGPIAGREEVWRLAWPFAYEDFVEASTNAPGSAEPTLVYAIMREESGYRPRVISPVGARGLLQIMRETGERLAARLGRGSFHPDELFDPKTNIELGASYLGELRGLFPKRLSASIASYNAGPHVVGEWAPKGRRSDDEWVESIPYAETQSYVKRVLRSMEAYRRIYPAAEAPRMGPEAPVPPPSDPKSPADGIEPAIR